MASTYSSRLRIELIGTGEQSGIWGDTTNTNLGTLIDEAIAGVAPVTMTDADYTLTVANGATDQSRKAVVVLSGTLSAARNVICPTSQKVYIVKNSTTGGYAITFKTSAGSGVSVPNGKTMLLYCDGTDVLSGVDSLSSASIAGGLTVNGNTTLGDSSSDTITITGTVQPGVVVSGSSSGDAVRITQAGSGNALLVEDASNPDATPFVVTGDGSVGVGTGTPGSSLDVKGTIRLSGASSGYVGLAPASAAGSTTYTLPSADGTNGQYLSTNGSGTLAWASGLSTGTSNTFTAAQTFRAADAIRSEAAATQDAIILAGRAGGTSSYAITLTPSTLSSSTTLTLPNVSDTVAVVGTAQTFTAAQTFRAANAIRSEAAATQDAVVLAGRAGGTSSYAVTLRPTTLSGNRTLTLPNVTDTLAVLGTAQTFTAAQTFTGSTSVLATVLTNAAETTTISATAATGTINYDITTQSVLYYTSNASANWTVNFRASSGTSLNTAMATGQSITVAFLVTQGATAYYNNAVQVDGSSVTPKWQGGTAPTAGNASSIDVYTYTIVKTGSAAFTVFASQTQFK